MDLLKLLQFSDKTTLFPKNLKRESGSHFKCFRTGATVGKTTETTVALYY